MERRTWEEYALAHAEVAAEQSEDPYVKVGACSLRGDHTIAGVGFNGPPSKVEIDWSDREGRRKRVIHAEVNCLCGSKLGEVELLASTLIPCLSCLSFSARHGVKKIVYREGYRADQSHYGSSEETHSIAKEFGVELVHIPKL